jgi:hypothetical protein
MAPPRRFRRAEASVWVPFPKHRKQIHSVPKARNCIMSEHEKLMELSGVNMIASVARQPACQFFR